MKKGLYYLLGSAVLALLWVVPVLAGGPPPINSTPEPASLLLVAGGVAGYLALKRRKK